MTLKFYGWPGKIIGHLFYTTSSFVHNFKSFSDGQTNRKYHSLSCLVAAKNEKFSKQWRHFFPMMILMIMRKKRYNCHEQNCKLLQSQDVAGVLNNYFSSIAKYGGTRWRLQNGFVRPANLAWKHATCWSAKNVGQQWNSALAYWGWVYASVS